MNVAKKIFWFLVVAFGAGALGFVAIARGEPINAVWLVVASVCIYAIGYRFYSRFLSDRVLQLDDKRATPAERLEDGQDFVPTNKWVVFGHHFSAIAGAGPLVGPILAAQFGYLPGTLWIIIGGVLGGAVQDLVILFCSVRRDGKSLAQMAKEEVSGLAGIVALFGVLSILTIVVAVIALVVVNALKGSPWGFFTIAMTMPIAFLMGIYMRYIRVGHAIEASLLGFVLVMASVVGGRYIGESQVLSPYFTYSAVALAWMLVIYGFFASVIPVWLLLAPRGVLSTFVKIGTILLLAVGILAARPTLLMPPLTRFIDGTGPIFAGKIFPFCFITIACGALSGFHALIASGTTPKMLSKESQARMVGYGSMLMESFVAVMALIAACVLKPGIYFAVNSPAGIVGKLPQHAVTTISNWGFPVTAQEMSDLAAKVGEVTLFNRAGGAPSLAVGMAHIFSGSLGGASMGIWYHFAIMFEALFILTILDAGTRVGRFLLQDLMGHFWKPLGKTSWLPGIILSSGIMVAAWGYFLLQGVMDPLGGINSLWPLFGISNQLLAAIALCVGTTILIKMGKSRYILATVVPLVWLVSATLTASAQKIWSSDPRIGFLADARRLGDQIAAGAIPVDKLAETHRLIFNDRLDASVTLMFALVVLVILFESGRNWWLYSAGKKRVILNEAPVELSKISA
jgi:carbon starvation protein